MDLNPMRDDYRLVRRWWAEAEGWADADLVEADVAVKAAVDSGDVGLITCWANWLAGIAAGIRADVARVRAMEERMREQAKKERAAREGRPA